jgi:hypothetical protein
MYGAKLLDFAVGQRVELHPVTSRWMMGDRYATVEKIGRVYVHVRFDRSGASGGYHPCELRGM